MNHFHNKSIRIIKTSSKDLAGIIVQTGQDSFYVTWDNGDVSDTLSLKTIEDMLLEKVWEII